MRRFVSTLCVVTITGCAAAGGSPATTPAASPDAPGAALPASLAAGRQVVESVCLTCHSLRPPHKTAPPLSMIATRYLAAAPDSAAAAVRIATWARDPDPAKSLLPAHAIERFGPMPPLDLPETDLRNAAAYILSLGAEAGGGMGGTPGMGARHGVHRP